MSKMAFAALKWLPVLVLIAYGGVITGYHQHLGSDLTYIRPQIPAAPEDILGFGFWVPWLLVAACFAAACILSYRSGAHKIGYWIPLFCIFALLSGLDFYLYDVLERQVLAG